jgi:hypothetical protein
MAVIQITGLPITSKQTHLLQVASGMSFMFPKFPYASRIILKRK